MSATIAICMATWNGAAYLDEQLESIAAQSCTDWHLYVRDDGSDDATLAILSSFAVKHPGRLTVVEDALGRLGASGNFSHLMGLVEAPYVAFSDQDDIWRPNKLARALAVMRALEAQQGTETPIMIHADRRLVDAQGTEITPSFWRSRGIVPSTLRGEAHLSFCVAAGATMLINRAMVTRALPVPKQARMYDCWIELVAHAFGTVVALEDIALDHRRHGRNTTGAQSDIDSPTARLFWLRAARLWRGLDRQRVIISKYLEQANAFQACYAQTLGPSWKDHVALFLSLSTRHGTLRRLWTLQRSRAAPPSIARTLVFAVLSGPAPRFTTGSR